MTCFIFDLPLTFRGTAQLTTLLKHFATKNMLFLFLPFCFNLDNFGSHENQKIGVTEYLNITYEVKRIYHSEMLIFTKGSSFMLGQGKEISLWHG